jgi:hypothetical protein
MASAWQNPVSPPAGSGNEIRARSATVVDNADMAAIKRGETTLGPLAFGGQTITLVARTTALHVGDDARGALHIRSHPVHVEVLDGEGRREVVHIRDTEHTLMVAIVIATVVGTSVLRIVRSRRSSR